MTGPSPTWSHVLYLLDANVLITAHRDYYAVARVPEFWHWLQHQAAVGKVKVPVEILEEVKRGRPRKGMDDLLDWLNSADVKDTIPLDEEPDPALVRRVMVEGYAPNLNEHELVKLGRDPFLIAYALANPAGRRIVTRSPGPRRGGRTERSPMLPGGSGSRRSTHSSLRGSWTSRPIGGSRSGDHRRPWLSP